MPIQNAVTLSSKNHDTMKQKGKWTNQSDGTRLVHDEGHAKLSAF